MKRLIRSILSAARGVSSGTSAQSANDERARQLIVESGLFDAEFYGKSYPDVLAAKIDPLDHYIKNGRKEGRQPSARFNPKGYLLVNTDLDPDTVEPVMHYILQGKAEGRVDRFPSKIDSIEKAKLKSFLATPRLFSCHPRDAGPSHLGTDTSPLVSAILILQDDSIAVLPCLEALLLETVQTNIPIEIILVDNGSRDETPLVLKRLVGAQILVNSSKLSFAAAANLGADVAQGKYLLFLNGGALPVAGSVPAALQAMTDGVGAVGGKIISSQGQLIEAGGVLFSDGEAASFSSSGDILAKEVLFRRQVFFSSADFLLTRSESFKKVGKFALEGFEEVDYCLRLGDIGQRTVYDPNISVFRCTEDRREISQKKGSSTLVAKHPEVIKKLSGLGRSDVLYQAYTPGKRLLYIDDRLPLTHLGAGFPRTKQFIEILVAQQFQISFLPLSEREPDLADMRLALPPEVQVITIPDLPSLSNLLAEQAKAYDVIVISRIHNLSECFEPLQRLKELKDSPRPYIVYDAEAVFADRSLALAALRESEPMRVAALEARTKEFNHAKSADLILSVSKSEVSDFAEATGRPVLRLGTYFNVPPSPRPFAERRGFLILASYHGPGTPNHDALSWFLKQVWPLLDKSDLGPVQVVGYRAPGVEMPPMPQNVNFLGQVDDLGPLFNECRVFIAPTRFASGIPLKCVEAASYGLPMVVTDVLSKNLGWSASVDHLAASHKDVGAFVRECSRLYTDQGLWESIRTEALQRISQEYSRPVFEAQVAEAFGNPRDA